MKKVLLGALVALTMIGCGGMSPEAKKAKANEERIALEKTQDIRIYKTPDDNNVCKREIFEKALEANGFIIDGNNDMNKPFSVRFKEGAWYKKYRLMTIHNPDLVAKLAKDYPSIGLLTPFSMSYWAGKIGETEAESLSISSLTLRGASRITQIPMDNPYLIEYIDNIEKALRAAFPQGEFTPVKYAKVADMTKSLATSFTTEFEVEEGGEIVDAVEDFQGEFEGEMEPIGFLFPGFIGVNDQLIDRGVEAFTFYDTYSVCKLDVIHPISKNHPEVGAFAPCTFYMYQKIGETEVHMGFPSVDNWIQSTDLEDEYSLKPLVEAQNLFVDTVKSIIE